MPPGRRCSYLRSLQSNTALRPSIQRKFANRPYPAQCRSASGRACASSASGATTTKVSTPLARARSSAAAVPAIARLAIAVATHARVCRERVASFSACRFPRRRNTRPSGGATGRWDVHRYGNVLASGPSRPAANNRFQHSKLRQHCRYSLRSAGSGRRIDRRTHRQDDGLGQQLSRCEDSAHGLDQLS